MIEDKGMENMKFENMVNQIILGDCYELIKCIPNKSIDCIYVDIPYLYSSGYHKHENNCNVGISDKFVGQLKDIISGIDYSIYDEFIRISKVGNIFIWLSKEQIKYTLDYFIGKGFSWEILTWHKTNPQPLAHNSWLSDTEYCLYFRKKGVILNDGFDLKSKYYISSLEDYVLTNINSNGWFTIRLKDNQEYVVQYRKENGKMINFIEKDGEEIPLNDEVTKLHLAEVRIYQREGV